MNYLQYPADKKNKKRIKTIKINYNSSPLFYPDEKSNKLKDFLLYY